MLKLSSTRDVRGGMLIGLLMAILVVSSGCDSTNTEVAGTTKVTVSVTMNEQPVPDARVVFIPIRYRDVTGEALELAQGVTDENGICELAYRDQSTQIAVVDYDVIVTRPSLTQNRSRSRFLAGRHSSVQAQLGEGTVGMFATTVSDMPASINHYSQLRVALQDDSGSCNVDIALQSDKR